jgi:hypothetical protein
MSGRRWARGGSPDGENHFLGMGCGPEYYTDILTDRPLELLELLVLHSGTPKPL